MKITGNYTVNADVVTIWKLLQDREVLERITPGISQLLEIGKDKYKAISEIKIGPVRGAFEGELEVKDKIEQKSMIVALDQKSKIGNAIAEIALTLHTTDDNKTTIVYEGDAKLSGTIARMGQRIVGGVVSTLSKQFFKELEKEVDNNNS